MDFKNEQHLICEQYGSPFYPSPLALKVGISRNVNESNWPINGLRHPPESDTTGWYIWAGEEFSYDPDFFIPMHVEHLLEVCPIILKYLALAPGWRFLITHTYEDVWHDPSLLII